MDALFTIGSVAAMTLVVYALGRLSRMTSQERVHCEKLGKDFEVDFDRRLAADWGPGKRLEVLACTAFPNPARVDCEKACLGAR
jgi:hypothetical protein